MAGHPDVDDEDARRFEAYIEMVRNALGAENGVLQRTALGGWFLVERGGIRLVVTRTGSRIEYLVTDQHGPVEHGELTDEESVRAMLGRFTGRGGTSLGS